MSTEHNFGNLITANTASASDGKALIDNALQYIQTTYGFAPVDERVLFTGVYYDSKKVGSFITKVKNEAGDSAVLKLQLHPLPFDEGFIIRNLEQNLKTRQIRPVKILHDKAWTEERGFGYLLFEDISHLPNIWADTPTQHKDRLLHKKFIEAFYQSVLPILHPWIDRPKTSLQEKALEAFEHFHQIAQNSAHKHITEEELKPFSDKYLEILKSEEGVREIEFTHGHLSGYDVKYDKERDQFILMANLYWSWRPKHYELIFPIWIDVMQIRSASLSFDEFLERIMAWHDLWQEQITHERVFWLMLLDRSMHTIMLDLGASEWKTEETEEKQALLESWKMFFHWIIEEKLS